MSDNLDMTLREVMQTLRHGETLSISKYHPAEIKRWRFFNICLTCRQDDGRIFSLENTVDPDAPEPIRIPWMDRETLDAAIARARGR